MGPLTVCSVILVLAGRLTKFGPANAMAVGGATIAGAALTLGPGVSVPTFYAVTLGLILVWVVGPNDTSRQGVRKRLPGALALVAFAVWSTVQTAVASIIFAGMPVLDASGELVRLSQEGPISGSNIAQLAYLWVGIGCFFIAANDKRTTRQCLLIGLALAIVLNLWSLAGRDFSLPFPSGLFDNSPNFRYIDTAPGDIVRFRGITPEPSALAGISLPAMTFAVALLPHVRGLRRFGAASLACGALVLGLVSTSTSFIVVGCLLAAICVIAFAFRVLSKNPRISVGNWILVVIATAAVIVTLPNLVSAVSQVVVDKAGTSSYADRSGGDLFSYGLVVDTYGFGVGVGSNRPSSFLASLLSQTGVIGLLLLAIAVVQICSGMGSAPHVRPVLWLLGCLLVQKLINGPDLNDLSGLSWLALAVVAREKVAVATPSFDASRARGSQDANLRTHRTRPDEDT